jgi:hypothetical protein
LEKFRCPPNDFSLDLYTYYKAKKEELKIATVPVNFGERLHGESKWAFNFKSRIAMIIRTWKYIFKLKEIIQKEDREC